MDFLSSNAAILVEVILVLGGALVFGAYQLRQLDRLKKEREEKERREAKEEDAA
jgi:hypothetical protein